ncbi:dephospho-CoA kinase, putative [Entamoeba histolytica HM-1:IMSS-B]|uniref:Dephospho-CoA kinase, putative n=6 Tax=Entamoeba histolytica TaxID=5759 RepID=C4MB67_ENTH1|nr:dephospho-CoA kinase, putative [Entamoeba histolytica HM-1:IMSS]EMD44330.1 dephospho CoA kinase, putative [Entamoeba histolytica KU27]EMH74245.1 dephospho-CoA kinase, putative [Entamoeba histolytica HM-1:IMSS-B]EMS13896.1 dephospho-CoA kinase [Entamoeba histolytica HM-3:IMSS]ENY65817.1 dephospho-CoA kinase, putative [Entamoeba histolytica HM-1:IMSS-A]GAT99167.1 dephospho-coa kinase putative [Entamoeba histolytica]|eukprot:XP_648971.1 dephospho-CoA kinase, putative [Entamoeba histolytica HM-1:IMSS]
MKKIFVIGITGSICSGKSRLCKALQSKGIKTIDSDTIGHDVILQEDVKKEIKESFGEEVFNEEGQVDRKRLSDVVFTNKKQLKKLNEIMWNSIENKIKEQIQQLEIQGEKIVAVEAALLIRTNWMSWMDMIWVTTVSPEIAIARMTAGRGMTREECINRMKNQPSSREYARYADILFDTRFNRGTLERIFNREINAFLIDFNENKF